MKGALCLVMLAGCGRVGFDARDDAQGGGSATVDAQKFFIDAGECPPGYTFDTMGCYRAFNMATLAKSWLAAEADCEADGPGSHLAVIDSAAEVPILDRQQPGTIIDHWIGMTDIVTDGVFLNVDGKPATYLNWDVAEPSAGDDCVLFNDNTTLASAPCGDGDDYVCEYDGKVPVPAAWGQ